MRLGAKIFFLLLLFSMQAIAGIEQVMSVLSDSADLNQKKHLGIYKGHVQFRQGKASIAASRAITKGDDNNQLEVAIVYGDKTSQAHYSSQPNPGKPPIHAYADAISYYPKRHLIELKGHARVEQGPNSLRAALITYDTKAQHVVTKSDASTGTTIILRPDKKVL